MSLVYYKGKDNKMSILLQKYSYPLHTELNEEMVIIFDKNTIVYDLSNKRIKMTIIDN